MTPPNYDLVVEDCNAALNLDAKYLKALNRRAIALEGQNKLFEALRGQLLLFPMNYPLSIYQISPLLPSSTDSRTKPLPTLLNGY